MRSFLADKIEPKFSNANDFKQYVISLRANHIPSSIVFSSRIDAILKNFIKDYQHIYMLFHDASEATIEKDHNGSSVPYVSQLINLIILFFKDLDELKVISNNYTTIEDFLYKCSLYHRVRNDLSHPGSRKILKKEASEILKFITKFIEPLDNKYFWYVEKSEIEKKISTYFKKEKDQILKFDNLKNINVSHQKTLCRETELNRLHELIVGNDKYARVAGSTVVYGYGGIGKTALIIDFIYEIIQRMQSEDYKDRYEFILFFSSKEEILTTRKTTGEFYIDKILVDIHSYDEILSQILSILKLNNLNDFQKSKLSGLIVIDNIENLSQDEKDNIFSFMRKIPRNVQFILTSRNEESAEEKIHLSEFKDFDKGKDFIISYIKSNDLELFIVDSDIKILLSATKGNTLLLVQSLLSLNDQTTTISEISNTLSNYESISFDKVANFMYKNTFDSAIAELESRGLNPKDIILIATLYKEKIDLYALNQLTSLSINEVRDVANFLASKLIFNKTREFYSVNEFASRFIFISLMPNKREKEILEEKIDLYKKDLNSQLEKLDFQMKSNEKIDAIISDWKPNNYIDKIIITKAFQMYEKFIKAIVQKNVDQLSKLFEEYSKYEFTTKHPYISFQKARILKVLISKRFYGGKTKQERIHEIKRCYEDTLESINTSYSYIKNTESHIAVLMFFGFFLDVDIKDIPKSIRYLEDALELQHNKKDKKYYLVPHRLSLLYRKMYLEKKDKYYLEQYSVVCDRILKSGLEKNSTLFSLEQFEKEQKRFNVMK